MSGNFPKTGVASGYYVPGDSFLHRMPVGLKLALVLPMCAGAALGTWTALLAFAAIYLCGLTLAGLSPSREFRGVKRFFWFLFVAGIFPLFFTPGDPLGFPDVLPIPITVEGAEQSALSVARLLLMFLLSGLALRVTSPQSLISAAKMNCSGTKPSRAREFVTVAALAFQFIPILLAEAESLAAGLKTGDEGEGLLARCERAIALPVGLAERTLTDTEYFAGRLAMHEDGGRRVSGV